MPSRAGRRHVLECDETQVDIVQFTCGKDLHCKVHWLCEGLSTQ